MVAETVFYLIRSAIDSRGGRGITLESWLSLWLGRQSYGESEPTRILVDGTASKRVSSALAVNGNCT